MLTLLGVRSTTREIKRLWELVNDGCVFDSLLFRTVTFMDIQDIPALNVTPMVLVGRHFRPGK